LPGAPSFCFGMEHLTPREIRQLLESGVKAPELVERLVATGTWSESGALEILSFMTRGPDELIGSDMTRTVRPTRAIRQSVEPVIRS